MVGKMVNGTGLTDDRRVSEQVRLESESESYILNSSKGLAERDRQFGAGKADRKDRHVPEP